MEPLQLGEALVLHLCFVWFSVSLSISFSGLCGFCSVFAVRLLFCLFVCVLSFWFCLVLFCLLLFCSVLVVLLLFCSVLFWSVLLLSGLFCFVSCFDLSCFSICFCSNPLTQIFLHIAPKLFPDMLFDTWVALSTLGCTIWNDIVLVVFNFQFWTN